MMPAMGIYGSSGKVSDPLAGIGVIVGIVAAALTAILWLYHYQPDSTLLGSYSTQITSTELGDQMRVLAAVLGLMAVIAGIAASLGGRGRATSIAALLLGIFALSYPVLDYLDFVTRVAPRPL